MLKAIGGAVVYGFALYGLNKFIEQAKAIQRTRQAPGQEEPIPTAEQASAAV